MRRNYKNDEELLDYLRWRKETGRKEDAVGMERGGHVRTNDVTLWLFHLWFWHGIPVYTGRGRGHDEKTWHNWKGDNLGGMNGVKLQRKHDVVFGPHEHLQQMLLLDTTEVEA